MELKEQLRNLFETHHTYTRFLMSKKCDPDLKAYVLSGKGDTLLEKVYNLLNDNPVHACRCCGKDTPLIDATNGYREFCNNACRSSFHKTSAAQGVIEKLKTWGNFEYHGGHEDSNSMMEVTNGNCGHRFKVNYINLFTNENYCPTCGKKDRSKKLGTFNVSRTRPKDKVDSYNKYKTYVLRQTRKLYTKHQHIINPNNYPITRVDLHDNAWNVDHIVPIVYCWENGIDADLCASLENIRVMKARRNISKNKKMTQEAMEILTSWGFTSSL